MNHRDAPYELEALGAALAELMANDPQLLPALADRIVSVPGTIPCDKAVAAANGDQLSLMIDMLKWPTCGDSRDGVMLRIATLRGKAPDDRIGRFEDPTDRSTYHANLREFIAWLKTQRGPDNKPFDIDGPPIHNPYRHR